MEHTAKPAATSKRHPWLPVVAAIIRREKSVLLGLRPSGGSLAGKWEFPGGKIEIGEQPEIALARELKEELGIDAEIGPLRFSATHHYGEVGVIILFYEVNYWKGQPSPLHHSEVKWVLAEEIHKLQLPDANRNVLDKIVKLLK
ncbi:MAG: (deoxy)nucleoside triphosphate pyrophosphohydrolase [Bdellovibrionales bacterium]|nr:(deoxy)nucleoside triphosphate pyrophosphohydrolase [Bdellovibrionales bacterium]